MTLAGDRRSARIAIAELDASTRRILGRRLPELSGFGAAVVIASAGVVRSELTEALRRLVAGLNSRHDASVEQVVDEVLAGVAAGASHSEEDGRREAEFRRRLLHDVGTYGAAEVAARAGSAATNRSQLAYSWRKEGRIFAVPVRGELRYLAFQFDDDGQPLPVVADVLAALDGWSEWRVAAWFVTANGLLDRHQPVAELWGRPDVVVAAAQFDGRRPQGRP